MGKGTGILLNDTNDQGEILDLKIEPVRNASGKIISGLVVGNSLEQNKALLLITQPGEFKFRPDLGVGIEDLLLSNDFLEYRHKIRQEFEKDGLNVKRVDLFENKPVKIEADYES